MSDIAIKVEDIGKQYRIGKKKSGELRETFGNLVRSFRPSAISHQPSANNSFWALKDISFEVKQGEAVGIIGRNGAGKSTLLKVLSRITRPTTGRFEINGRVSSLLEVGTGFHPELTGRENIYLNGTILGMRRAEIKAKFDEIVAFSGVEAFIDTPVKHYSSGMKVRLAFSVAAHLEPEILIIDEVLAVGDSTFQNKCVRKMTEVIHEGRTVLFVSHNMQAVKNLCPRSLLLVNGIMDCDDYSEKVISHYLFSQKDINSTIFDFTDTQRTRGANHLVFNMAQINTTKLKPGDPFQIKLSLKKKVHKVFKDLLFGFNIKDNFGNDLVHLSNIFIQKNNIDHTKDTTEYIFRINSLNIKPGMYHGSLFLRADEEVQDWIENGISFEIIDGNIYSFSNSQMITGIVQPEFEFSLDEN
jgi:lipopolysaccharide transport system ATP-binding protein